MDLLAWWNLIFELPFLAVLIYVLLLASGTVAAGEGGEVDQDLDAGAEVDQDLDAGVEADHDVDHGIEHVVIQGNEPLPTSTLSQVLGFFGLGKVPLSVLIITICTVWSLFGWLSNLLLQGFLPPGLFVWISVVVAGVSSLFLTRYVARAVSKLLPSVESYGVDEDALVGASGEARYQITETFGEAQVRDRYGNLHQVSCRIAAGSDPIPSGSSVVLLNYMPEKKLYIAITEEQFKEMIARPS